MVAVGAICRTGVPRPHVVNMVIVKVDVSNRAATAYYPAVIKIIDVIIRNSGIGASAIIVKAPRRIVHSIVVD